MQWHSQVKRETLKSHKKTLDVNIVKSLIIDHEFRLQQSAWTLLHTRNFQVHQFYVVTILERTCYEEKHNYFAIQICFILGSQLYRESCLKFVTYPVKLKYFNQAQDFGRNSLLGHYAISGIELCFLGIFFIYLASLESTSLWIIWAIVSHSNHFSTSWIIVFYSQKRTFLA